MQLCSFYGIILPSTLLHTSRLWEYLYQFLCGHQSSGKSSDGEGVQCHTDLTTCCTGHQGMDRGDWYAPGSEGRQTAI